MTDKRFTWMHSGQIGAPQMNGAAGSNGQMLQVLDGALVNGFNPQTVTIATKTATTATLTFGVSHGYELLQIISVSGATDTALNGRHKVISKTVSTVTIDAVGVAVTTGAITTKVAPLGFESIFGSTDTLKRAYRSSNTQGAQPVLYLDMNLPAGHGYHATNPAKRAMVDICENMTTLGVQINSYTDVYNNRPTTVNGNMFWHQARGLSKTEVVTIAINSKWVIIGNGDMFYFLTEYLSHSTRGSGLRDCYAFGEVESLAGDIDRYNYLWMGAITDNDTANAPYLYSYNGSRYDGNPNTAIERSGFFIRDKNGAGVLQPMLMMVGAENVKKSSGNNNYISTPAFTSQSILGLPMFAKIPSDIRAYMPSIMAIPQNLSGSTANSDVGSYDLTIDNGMLIVSLHFGTNGNDYIGYFGFDLRA